MKNLKLFLTLAFLISVSACAGTTSPNSAASNVDPVKPTATATTAATPDEFATGRTLYEQNCAACHKENGTGGTMKIEDKTLDVDDLTSDKIKNFPDEKITRYIVNGVEDEGMPAFKDKLTDAEIKDVVRFVRTGIQKMPPQPAQ